MTTPTGPTFKNLNLGLTAAQPARAAAANDPAAAAVIDPVQLHLQGVEADINAGKFAEAANALSALRRQYPSNANVGIAEWLLAARANRHAAAITAAERTIKLAPHWPTPYYCLSQAQRNEGDIKAARESIGQALALLRGNLPLLDFAALLANEDDDTAAAEGYLREAYAIDPALPGIATMIGHAVRRQGRADEAQGFFEQALVSNADDAEAQHGLALLAQSRGDAAATLRHIDAALKVRPQEPRYVYVKSLASGQTPEQQPEESVRRLFDTYARNFDTHLAGVLKYRTHRDVAAKILAQFPDRKLNVLDLGCGTGLVGAALGPIEGYLVGVDLSLPMIRQAHKHEVYSRFHQISLFDALESTDANEYEVIVAADVIVYIGELQKVVVDAFKVLKPDGLFLFSCETAPADGPDYVLGAEHRFAHNPAYVERLLKNAGYMQVLLEDVDLRTENEVMVRGILVSARKPG